MSKKTKELHEEYFKNNKEKIFNKIKEYIGTLDEIFMDIYSDEIYEKYTTLKLDNFDSFFDIKIIDSKIKRKAIVNITYSYISKELLPISFLVEINKDTIIVKKQSNNITKDFSSVYPSFSPFYQTLIFSYIYNIKHGFYRILNTAFANICKNTFSDLNPFNIINYSKYIYDDEITGVEFKFPNITKLSKRRISLLGGLYFNLLSSQFSLKQIKQFYDENDFNSIQYEINDLGSNIILMSGDYHHYLYPSFVKYFDDLAYYLREILDKSKKLKSTSACLSYEDSKILRICFMDEYIEIKKLLSTLLFYSSLLFICISPFFDAEWKHYSLLIYSELNKILKGTSIEKIDIQTKEVTTSPESRKNQDATTRLQIIFRLDFNYDYYLLRFDLAHIDTPFIHINLEETLSDSMTDSAVPLSKNEICNLSTEAIKTFLYFYENKFWFKHNFDKNYANYKGDDKDIINSLFNKNKHYDLKISDEKSFCDFIKEFANIHRLYLSNDFFELSFNKDNEKTSKYINDIRQKDNFVLELNNPYKDLDETDDLPPLDEELCEKTYQSLLHFFI